MAEITVQDITEGSIDGAGVFDELMTAVELRLVEQFSKGRIQGSDYATVYLGAMQSAMAQAVQFVLGKQAADKQAELLAQQVVKSASEVDLLNQKKLTEQAQILDSVDGNTVAGLVGKQKELYTNQANGFLRDAEQKGAKVFSDLWSIAKSSDPDGIAEPFHIDQASMDVVLEKVAEGFGIDKASLNV